MIVTPVFNPVTKPVASTVATLESTEVQSQSAIAFAGLGTAVSFKVLPTSTLVRLSADLILIPSNF